VAAASTGNLASTTSLKFFTDQMLFLTPNEQCQSTIKCTGTLLQFLAGISATVNHLCLCSTSS